MRWRSLVVCVLAVVLAGGVGVRPARASTGVPVTGAAIGGEFLSEGSTYWEDAGGYATSGQLGHGRFDFVGTTACPGAISGTATLTRFDGAVLRGTVTGVTSDCYGITGTEHLSVNLTSGTRDLVSAQLSMDGTLTNGRIVLFPNFTHDEVFQINGSAVVTSRIGYVMTDVHGHVSAFGGAPSLGDAPTPSATRVALTPTGRGYWIVDSAGRVFAFGDGQWFGNAPPLAFGETVRSIAPTATGIGYWLFTSTGRVLPFGDAHFYGDMHATRLNGSVIDAATSADRRGYYLVGSDGGVFTFGDAHFYGSTGSLRLNQPVNGIATTGTGNGYWLVASDGGVFAFGDARFHGSMGSHHLNQPIIAIARYGNGYLMVATDGGIFNFSDQLFFGSLGGTPPGDPIIAVTTTG